MINQRKMNVDPSKVFFVGDRQASKLVGFIRVVAVASQATVRRATAEESRKSDCIM
jgi:hypothetical protein